MSLALRPPGVYVIEKPSSAGQLEAVGTSTAGFVGVAPRKNAPENRAIAVGNWSEFVRTFVQTPEEAEKRGPIPASTALSNAVYGFFQNGGSRVYIVNVGEKGSIAGGGTQRSGLQLFEEINEIKIVAAPGCMEAADYQALLGHAETLQDRFAILDLPEHVADRRLLTQVKTVRAAPRRGGGGSAGAGDGADAAAPAADTGTGSGGFRPSQSDRGFGAAYYPWGIMTDPLNPKSTVNVPLSGHIAGVYARVDAQRGVFKAPANEAILGLLGLTDQITDAEQADLNANSVNCIRYFGTEGIRIWGARTLAASSSEWRYIPVRRLFNMVEETIARGTRWVVFEPNDERLWARIRRDLRGFLMTIWRAGALAGATPEEAFFVRCDAETNPPEDVKGGIVRAIVGLAPVRPAEFVIFEVSQRDTGAEVS